MTFESWHLTFVSSITSKLTFQIWRPKCDIWTSLWLRLLHHISYPPKPLPATPTISLGCGHALHLTLIHKKKQPTKWCGDLPFRSHKIGDFSTPHMLWFFLSLDFEHMKITSIRYCYFLHKYNLHRHNFKLEIHIVSMSQVFLNS